MANSPAWSLPASAWPELPAGIGFLATLRHGGHSAAPYDDGQGGGGLNLGQHVGDAVAAVEANRARVGEVMAARPVWLNQVHGGDVVDVSAADPAAFMAPAPGQVVTADASISSQAGIACAILTADCLPVLFCDTAGSVVGAAHAGWRGLAGGVLHNTLAAMRAAGAGEIIAWLGPAIGPQRFEVSADVLAAFEATVMAGDAAALAATRAAFSPIAGQSGKYLADIYALARLALAADGVVRISGGDRCTGSEPEAFYSYRRDKVTGRQASLIWIK
jgi:YfiH family protein